MMEIISTAVMKNAAIIKKSLKTRYVFIWISKSRQGITKMFYNGTSTCFQIKMWGSLFKMVKFLT